MGCLICHRSSCAKWMHSLEDQERFEARESMSSDVNELRSTIQELQDEISNLKSEMKDLESENMSLHALRE